MVMTALRQFFATPIKTAWADVAASAEYAPFIKQMAWREMRARYSFSKLGVLWVVLSFAVLIAIKLLIFNNFEGGAYVPHLILGFVTFTFISIIISAGVSVFVSNRQWILSSTAPYSVYVFVFVIRAFLEMCLIGVTAVLMLVPLSMLNLTAVWAVVPALVLYLLTAFAFCLMFGAMSVRYRDLIHTSASIARILFFATPILWFPVEGTLRYQLAKWNPVSYYIDLVRVPLMDGVVPLTSWYFCASASLGLLLLALLVFGKVKPNLALGV